MMVRLVRRSIPYETYETLQDSNVRLVRRSNPCDSVEVSNDLQEGFPCDRMPDGQMWCVTRQDLGELKEAVTEALEEIPNDADFHNETHDDPKFGPSVYQVVKCFLMPRLKRGESWALKQHPQGLKCDVFATHSWDEGIFEFIEKALQIFPSNAHYMYICFLANPQDNDSLVKVLSKPVEETPFAQALKSARYLVVISNQKTSIYTRLWCVYEMYLAHQAVSLGANMSILLPWIDTQTAFWKVMPICTILPCVGFLLGFFVISMDEGIVSLFGPAMWILFSLCLGSTVRMIVRVISWIKMGFSSIRNTPMWEWRTIKYWNHVELLLMGICSGLSWHYFVHKHHSSELAVAKIVFQHAAYLKIRWEVGEGTACFYFIATLFGTYVYDMFMVLANEVLIESSGQLKLQSVRNAQCSSNVDRAKIINAMNGMPSASCSVPEIDDEVAASIDETIHQLKLCGRYDKDVKLLLDLGLSPAFIRDGVNPFRILCGICAWTFWITTDLYACKHYAFAHLVPIMMSLLGLGLVFMPSSVNAGKLSPDSRLIFAVHAFFYSGIAFLLISNHPRFFNRETVEKYSMSSHTILLQAFILLFMLLMDAFFYSGMFAALAGKVGSAMHAISMWADEQPDELTDEEEYSRSSSSFQQSCLPACI